MKKTFLFLAIIASFTLGFAQTMHIVLLINTQEQGRSIDRTADYDNMRRFFTECAENAGMTPRITHLGSSQFDTVNVRRVCSSLSVVKNTDAIVFYYSGHGANDRSSQWPVLALKNGVMRMGNVTRLLRSHSPKFLMVMADCCNNFYNGNTPPVQANPQESDLYRLLFREFKGNRQVLVSASSPGEFSLSHPQQGALWGMAFREALYRAADNSNTTADWLQIFNTAKSLTNAAAQSGGQRQTAQFNVVTQADDADE